MGFIKTSPSDEKRLDTRQQPRDRRGLILGLDDAVPAVRRWAARDLADYPDGAAALLKRLQCEPDPSVRQVILTSLTRIGDATAVAGLVALLGSDDAGLRNEAIEVMKALPQQLAPIMPGLLRDPNPDVRILAINILESLRHPDVESWLIAVIDHDPLVNVCGAAVDLLTEVGTGAARAALERLQARFPDEPYIQFAAKLALKRIQQA